MGCEKPGCDCEATHTAVYGERVVTLCEGCAFLVALVVDLVRSERAAAADGGGEG